MADRQSETKQMHLARDLLASVMGAPLTLEERVRKTIELVALILSESNRQLTKEEKRRHDELQRMVNDPIGKVFLTAMTDQCFRSTNHERIAEQVVYLLHLYGIPKFFSPMKRLQLYFFKILGDKFAKILVPIAIWFLQKEASSVIVPGEKSSLNRHIKKRRGQGVRLNLNHLGAPILGEEEAARRLNIYLEDLKNPLIDYISIKLSTIYSQINLLSYENTLNDIAERLRELYRAAMENTIKQKDGRKSQKFVNLDMEGYKDLHLTKDLFMKVLSEHEFKTLSAGIVLQAYLPDSHPIQKELTEWAMERVKNGGAPIKIRIVKGANIAMEEHEASLNGWPQAPYNTKIHTDANYKRMVLYGCEPDHARAVHIGIASHNLFDIAFAMILRLENRVERETTFEMFEGVADHTRRVVQKLTGDVLLYCAVAKKEDFQSALAYLTRRLDENTGAENFLAHSFELKEGTKEWEIQSALFSESCKLKDVVETSPRKTQNRQESPIHLDFNAPFENEADTDFSLPHNQKWAEEILDKWKEKKIDPIPLVIDGEELHTQEEGKGYDPSSPGHPYYTYSKGGMEEIDQAISCAKKEESDWANTPIEERSLLLSKAAQQLRENRGDQIGSIVGDGGKTVQEADMELSKAIDFAEYYLRSMRQYATHPDIEWTPKGTILVASPWNFPKAIPAGGIFAALVTGNCVLFKPAPEAVMTGYYLAKALWNAGIPKKVFQFINCDDDPVGSKLIQDKRVNAVILTGATATAKLFMKMNPGIDLSAETGGKNALIITALSDRNLAIKELVQSAFGHSGQKCSAASLAILEKEVYDDPHFMQQLRDATASLKVGSPWDLKNKMTPLINPPNETLHRGLTTLEPGESWLLEPKVDPHNPHLWTPGIKLGVQRGNFTQKNELFGPVLGLIRADNLDQAIHIANSTVYGLTSGIHSLDRREQKKWRRLIIAGNCYINRTITGSIVRRQAFGGIKNSSFGRGSKAGGPNYLTQFMHAKQIGIPKEKFPISNWVNNLTTYLEKFDLSAEDLGIWYASISSYAYHWQQFRRDKDQSKVIGEDNFFRYLPHKKMVFRITPEDNPLDYLRVFAAALTTETRLEISWEKNQDAKVRQANWEGLLPIFNIIEEEEKTFIERMKHGHVKRIRMLSKPSSTLKKATAEIASYIDHAPVLANGRIELLHYLREVSLSISYHRYGNLGLREGELRRPLL